MAHLTIETRARLERLRETDTTGVYASDEFSSGTSPDRALSVTVDPTLRVTEVQVHVVELVRDPGALGAAFARAYSAALAARYTREHDERAGATERPVARRVVLTVRRPTPEMLNRHQTRVRANTRPRPRFPQESVGLSHNQCVTVTLPVAGGRGRLEVDAGWLSQTGGARLATAITEAYTAAYARRDS